MGEGVFVEEIGVTEGGRGVDVYVGGNEVGICRVGDGRSCVGVTVVVEDGVGLGGCGLSGRDCVAVIVRVGGGGVRVEVAVGCPGVGDS